MCVCRVIWIHRHQKMQVHPIVCQPIAVQGTGDTIDPCVMDQLLGLDAEQQQKMSGLFLLGLKQGHCLS